MSDLIADLLSSLRVRARIFHRGQHCGDWAIPLEGNGGTMFHLVTHGDLLLEIDGASEQLVVSAGDLVLFARAGNHVLRARDSRGMAELHLGFEDGVLADSTGLVCGRFEFPDGSGHQLLKTLPDSIHVPATSHSDPRWLRKLVDLIVSESAHPSLASEAVMERLADALFIHSLRSYLRDSSLRTGLLAALADPALRPVLEMVQREPHRPWTVADMTTAANLSRSAFVGRFTRTLGVAPVTYLTQLRLERGRQLLAESGDKVLNIAFACGYESEAAFSKAFKREFGLPPSVLRKRLRHMTAPKTTPA